MFNIFFKTDPETAKQLDRMETLLRGINERTKSMALDLSRIQAEVAENVSVTQSAVALIGQIAQQIRDNVDNQTALNALADQLDTDNQSLGAAVVANTVHEVGNSPAPEPQPEPAEQPVV